MKIFHAEMLTAGKPVKNLNFILLIVGSRAPGRFSKQRDLLEAFEGVAGRHHYPNAVIGYQLRETIHIVGDSTYLQVFLNERLIGFTEHVSLHSCTCFLWRLSHLISSLLFFGLFMVLLSVVSTVSFPLDRPSSPGR